MMKFYLRPMLVILLVCIALPGLEQTLQAQKTQQTGRSQGVTGIIRDEKGEPVAGVTIRLKKSKISGTITKSNGEFSILIPDTSEESIICSFLGLKTQEVAYKKDKLHYEIVLKEDSNVELEEVVVQAGIIQRDKMGFTGGYSSFSGDALKSIGNQNVLQSLKTLDPSFIIMDNNLAGSNPNALSTIEVRGQTSLDIGQVKDDASINPNTPLFVVDGFESTLKEVSDLDMNRVLSLTLLKDAGSTAIYGSKGANGVIVIETVKPVAGEIMVRYNADLSLSFADLSDYNMMNASEKLEFELQSGRYGPIGSLVPSDISKMDFYYQRLKNVASGIDTDWLSEPVRVGLMNKHSVSVSGGSNELLFLVGLNYGNNEGVMKDDFRKTIGGNVKLIYRSGNVNVANNITITSVNSQASPYAPYSDFVQANPYYTKRNADGSIPKYLEYGNPTLQTIEADGKTGVDIPNPLYNASLESSDRNNYFTVVNNTNLNWYVNQNLVAMASIGVNKSITDATKFIDPEHTQYEKLDYTKKGSYKNSNTDAWGYNANASINYNKQLLDHNFTLIGRTSMSESNRTLKRFEAVGFPVGSNGVPSFAYSYLLNSRPGFSETKSRSVNALAAFNYNYKFKYLFDANYTIEGANTFGSNQTYAPFWSLGAGWNVQKEEFAKNLNWLSELRIRSNYGITANQNLQLVTSSVYGYYPGTSIFGQGSYLSQFGNPDLKWQKVGQFSVNVDAGFFANRLKLQFSTYTKRTDPLVVTVEQKPSTGIYSYPINLGYMDTKGLEFMASFSPIYDLQNRIIWTVRVSGSRNESIYKGFGSALNNQNSESDKLQYQLTESSLKRYVDNRSPNDIWAVKSLGIDPSSGEEVFLKKDGKTPTYTFDADDRVVVANSRPDLEGVIGTTFVYKQFEMGVNMRYRFGGYAFNNALYSKVENITFNGLGYNQDRRALYDRWKNPGDVAQYKGVNISESFSIPISSRFVQKDDVLSCESVNLSWDFSRDQWIKKFHLKDLKLTAYMNDLFRISSIKQERGTDYPFARTIAFSLSTRF